MIWSRVYRHDDVVLALADEELMGKKFEDGKLTLFVGLFYQGELVDEEKVLELLKEASIVNAVGEKAVATVIKAGLTKERFVKQIAGVPHVQAILRFL